MEMLVTKPSEAPQNSNFKPNDVEATSAKSPVSGSWYNGYSPKERDVKFKVMKQFIAKGELPHASGACMLCGDPEVPVEYHDEDYGEPFIWSPPALLCLCRHCHRDKLHKRFKRQSAWLAYIAHIRRGGYARDLNDPKIKKELEACRMAIERGESFVLNHMRPYLSDVGSEWFANLRMDPESLTDPTARPRPLTSPDLKRVQELFHGLIRARTRGGGINAPRCLPKIAIANGTKENPNWFPVNGMYGGFSYWIEWDDSKPTLHTESWCRIEGGSGQYHVITPDEVHLIDEGFV
jgi:hypothetical protein